MADGQKIPFGQKFNQGAARVTEELNAQNGKQLPCTVSNVSGSIVEIETQVKTALTIPKVNIPHFGGEWIRYPVQKGEKGFAISADASLNEMSGLGEGKADLYRNGNITPLVFMPIGNANWTPTNPNYLVMYGKDGVRIQSTVNAETYIELTADGIVIHGNVTHTGAFTSNGKDISNTHKHSGVQTGGGQTGTVV